MITVRATTVESFRLYSDPDVDFISADEMDARLLGKSSESSAAARLGTDFHAAVAGTYVGATLFDQKSVQKARRGLDGVPSEVHGSTLIDVHGTPVLLTGHADYLLGLDLLDLKTSAKPIPPDRHADSLQWRCYCIIFGAKRITYRHVQLDENEDGIVYAKSIDDVQMYHYPDLHSDVVRCLHAMLAYAHLRGLMELMDRAA